MKLSDLAFSDLFATEIAATSWFKATPSSLNVQTIPPDCEAELLELRRHLETRSGSNAFRVDWPDAAGLRLRVERMHIAGDKVVYVCRRFSLKPGTLTSLGVPNGIADRLLAPELNEGLIVICGKAGSGKSTTAASFITERLHRFGGVCWTIENPIELPLQGSHGKGWCYQTEASNDDDIGPAVRNMLRATPNILLIGELRDGLAVREAIAAATSGHLVVVTFHAADLVSGIARLARLAGGDKASAGIADALRVAMHLSLHISQSHEEQGSHFPGAVHAGLAAKVSNAPSRVLMVEPLWMSGSTEEGLRSIVRDGDFQLLKSEVERQRRSFQMGRLP